MYTPKNVILLAIASVVFLVNATSVQAQFAVAAVPSPASSTAPSLSLPTAIPGAAPATRTIVSPGSVPVDPEPIPGSSEDGYLIRPDGAVSVVHSPGPSLSPPAAPASTVIVPSANVFGPPTFGQPAPNPNTAPG